LEALAHVLVDLGEGPAVKLQPTADENGVGRELEGAIREHAAARLELAQAAIGMQEVDGAHEVTDGPLGRSRVHGQGASEGGGTPARALGPAEIQTGRLPDERGEAHPRARYRLLAVELGAPQAPFQLEHDAPHAPIAYEQIVAAADDAHG